MLCSHACRRPWTRSFNRITVDGDRSTNDTVLFFANGQAGNRPLKPAHSDWKVFCEAVNALTLNLALKIVEDGEGASKVVTVRVKGARTDADADIAARSVANSLLVKTSWVGEYPNWGRIMDALGYSDAKVDEERVEIRYDDRLAAKKGVAADTPLGDLQANPAAKSVHAGHRPPPRERPGRGLHVQLHGRICSDQHVIDLSYRS